jgi:hypothetical protein
MDAVTILRELSRARLLVGVAAAFALLIGVLMTYRISFPPDVQSRQYQVGIASARALVDTPSSQVVDLGRTGADIATLSSRANLLASLMTSSPIKDEIGKRAGVPDGLLVTPPPRIVGPGAANPPADVSGAVISASDRRAYVLRATVPTLEAGEIPIIAIDARAPDAKAAGRLADAAITVLQGHLESVAGTEGVPERRRITVRELGAARFRSETRGPSRILAGFATIFVFLVGCALVVTVTRLARSWRSSEPVEDDIRARRAEPVAPVETGDAAGAEDELIDEVPADETFEVETAPSSNGAVPVPSWLEDHSAGTT